MTRRTLTSSLPPEEAHRRDLLAKVHVAKKQLGLDDATYRALLMRVGGQVSAGLLDARALGVVLAEFRRLGWTPRARKGGPRPAAGPSPKPLVRKLYAIWGDLAPLLADGSPATLRAFVRRQTRTPLTPDGVDAPEFLDARQANRVIEGLKGWLARERAKPPRAGGDGDHGPGGEAA